MDQALHKLSAKFVANVVKSGRHSDGGGLYLNVGKSGSKSWLFMWVRSGKRREMGLGSFTGHGKVEAVSLAEARRRSSQCRDVLRDGGDPIIKRDKESTATPTFGQCADMYIEEMRHGWRNAKHAAQWEMTLTGYCGPIRSKVVSDIDTSDVMQVIRPMWKDKQETASRLRGRIERVLNFAKTKGWRSGENPAMWRGHLENLLPARRKLARGHHAAMPYADVPEFVERLTTTEALAARALEFLILTASRSGEVLNAKWSEFDLEEGVWAIPPTRMKAGKEHRVPLSGRALAIVKALHQARISDYIFPGQRVKSPLSSMALHMLMRRMKIENATPHGMRSAFRDWAGDETAFPREIAEAALAHNVGNEVERAYRRGDALEKRRALMQAWANFCGPPESMNIVTMHSRQIL